MPNQNLLFSRCLKYPRSGRSVQVRLCFFFLFYSLSMASGDMWDVVRSNRSRLDLILVIRGLRVFVAVFKSIFSVTDFNVTLSFFHAL
jgi:hypothetical protein